MIIACLRTPAILFFVIGFFVTFSASSYEVKTHADMTESAAKTSKLIEQLPNLGLLSATDSLKHDNRSQTIIQWIREGAEKEDDTMTEVFARYKNHFYDPTTGRGFGGILWRDSGLVSGMPAPDWAIDMVEADGQLYSFRQARTYFYDGLTQSTQAERESKLATMFRTLGDVVHIVQDMAQPQHTRNDGHGFPKSYYEVYTDDNRTNLLKALPAITTPSFSNARDFFVNSSYTGLSQYSNSNFVTAGTNFKMYQGKPVQNANYANPLPGEESVVRAADLTPKVSPEILDYCKQQGIDCDMTFYSTQGTQVINPRAATLSIYDQNVKLRPVTYTYSSSSASFQVDRIFTLNSYNFDAMHPLLIPRAVAYSTGMINYFFRGQIDFAVDPVNPGKYLIKNLSNEPMNGTFTLYYDAIDDKRYATTNKWNLSVDAGQSSTPQILQPIPLDQPDPKVAGEYMLVFDGAMGQEAAGSTTSHTGAVAAKAATDPLLMQFTRVLFSPSYPNQYNPTTRYYLDSNMRSTQELVDAIAVAARNKKSVSLLIDGKPLEHCIYWGANGMALYCDNWSYPYTQVTIDITGINSSSRVPYFDMDELPVSTGTISLNIEDATLLQFTFTPQLIQDFSPVAFTQNFHIAAKNASFGRTF